MVMLLHREIVSWILDARDAALNLIQIVTCFVHEAVFIK